MHKKLLLLSALLILSQTGFAQILFYDVNFDTTQMDRGIIFRDTISNPNNTWQIGFPHKEGFKKFYDNSNKKSLMTDTINNLPINDTSSIILGPIRVYLLNTIRIDYKIIGSEGDYGILEVSYDSGKTWLNIKDDPNWETHDNETFKADTQNLNWRTAYFTSGGGDIEYYRLTFITDSIENRTEGWIIRSFFAAYLSSIHSNYTYSNLLQIYPNPASSYLHIECIDCYGGGILQIFDMEGKRVFYNPEFMNTGMDISSLSPGIYTLLYQENGQSAMERIVVER